MRVILYSGISIDGFIAKNDGDSNWVAEFDGDVFDKMVEWAEVIVSVIPRVIGDGVRVFEGVGQEVNLELVEHELVDGGFVKVRYKVKRKNI